MTCIKERFYYAAWQVTTKECQNEAKNDITRRVEKVTIVTEVGGVLAGSYKRQS